MPRRATSELEDEDVYSEADTSVTYAKKNKRKVKSKYNGDSDVTSESDNEGVELDDEEDEEEDEEEVEEEELDEELDEEEEEEEEEEEIPSVSDEEENYKLEDPDEIDENLELEEEEEDYEEPIQAPVKKTDYSSKYKSDAKKASSASSARERETRKRQLSYYEEDEGDEEEDEEGEPVQGSARKSRRLPQAEVQPQELDTDLILTDEEQEYNPRANPDLSKMTERQRARYLEDEDNKKEFVELDESMMNLKKNKSKKKETEEEATLRKAESARRRQDYKMKQLEEEKRDTVNKLLKRRANKTREVNPVDGTVEYHKVDLKDRRPVQSHPALNRYISNTTTLNGNSILAFNSALN